MNDNSLNVPITNFACLSSLTDLLPELPLPGPAPIASNTNATILFNQSVAESGSNAILQKHVQLAKRLSHALAETNVDQLEMAEGYRGTTIPQAPLTQLVLANNPAAFGDFQAANANKGGNVRNDMVNGVGGSTTPPQASSHYQQSHRQQQAQAPQQQQAQCSVMPKINLDMSKEDKALMAQKLQSLSRDGGGNPISYNNFSPRAQRKKSSKYVQPAVSNSESEQSTDEEQRNKSKFFKHTEKERGNERRRRRDERRRRHNNRHDDKPGGSGGDGDDDDGDEDYAPDEVEANATDRRSKRKHDGGDPDTSWLKRRRKDDNNVGGDVNDRVSAVDLDTFVPRAVSRKIERKPAVTKQLKIDPEQLMESSNYKKFTKVMELVFDNAEEVNIKELEENDEGEIPPEIIISKYHAQDLSSEAAKLKSMAAMDAVPTDRLVKVLNILQWTVRDGTKVSPLAGINGDQDDDDGDEGDKLFLELAAERVLRAADCALAAMYIMTCRNMNKRVYIDDVIDKITLFVRYQLQNTIYPSYDPVYREMSKHKEGYTGSMKKKRSSHHTVRDRNITKLYSKCGDIVNLLAELLQFQLLTDTTVLHLSTLGVAPFFVENVPELQLSALKLVTGVFSKYDKHRKLILDDILASIARLPSSKHSLRTFRLSRTENIQMLTALVLQLIQCVVSLPERLVHKNQPKLREEVEEVKAETEPGDSRMDRDVLINQRYENAMATAVQFLTVFLKKCGSKSEETDFRPLFENFLQDLLTTLNSPEWPAAELLLSLLGKLLVSQFANKGTEVSLRISSLDYLGLVASRLRRDAVQSKLKLDTIDSIISCVKEAEAENGEIEPDVDKQDKHDEEEQRTRFLQRVLLDYLTVTGGEEDPNTHSSRHFYISQWFRDATAEIRRQKGIDQPKRKKKRDKREKTSNRSSRRRVETESESSEHSEQDEPDPKTNPKLVEVFRLTEDRKNFLVSKILPFGDASRSGGGKSGGKRNAHHMHHSNSLSSHIDHTSATLIVKYLSSKRPFFNSFDVYLKHILSVLTEQSIQVRSKALKCLASVVHEDPSVLSRDDMQRGVNYSFLDSATMVREAAVDLVGKFILHKAELIDKYYDMLSQRIMDTGVSVRKRVIKILKDICLEFPEYPRIPAICVKMIRRINDEEGIRKLVMEVFHNMWFVPVNERRGGGSNGQHISPVDAHLLITKAHNITDVVVSCRETGLDWFEQLLQTLFKPKEDKDDATKIVKEPSRLLVAACQQIVDCLVETVLKTEEKTQESQQLEGTSQGSQSHRIVACLTTTFLFAKIRPQLLINHVQTLQPYLNIKCVTKGDYQIISNVARTLELVVPLIEHPSQIFLSQLEEASIKLIMLHDKAVVSACLSCLGSVVNNVTKNFNLIRDCFRKYFGHIQRYRKTHMKDPNDEQLTKCLPSFRRALCIVGLLLRYFDFKKEEFYTGLETGSETIMTVYETIFYFMANERKDIQTASLQCLGNICIRHYDLMLVEDLKQKYIEILTQPAQPTNHKVQDSVLVLQVLNNIEIYLVEEEKRMIDRDKHWKDFAEKENLKEMGDVSSGMASTIIQVFLKSVLESFIHQSVQVRHAALKVISLILGQGLVHPVQIVPYLICMSTDVEQRVSHTADRELQEIEKKYPGFIHMKLMQGIRLSYKLQEVLCNENEVLRGFRVREGEHPTALNGFLYSCLRSTKAQRRAILTNLLKQFDDSLNTSLSMMLYLADNLAYIPYTVIDEPLYLIHHIDLMVSIIGTNILQSIKEALKLPPEYEIKVNQETGKQEVVYDEDLDEDPESVYSRLPDTLGLANIQKSLTASQGCLLILVLREHLKDFYAINETKIQDYSPSESQKIYERGLNRRGNAKFNPKATVEILKHTQVPADQLDEEGKRDLINKYLGFKELMNRIEKDDDEYDEDGNLIVQGPMLNAKELQTMGMPIPLRSTRQTNGAVNAGGGGPPAAPNLPPGIQGKPESFNPVIRIQNIPIASIASSSHHPSSVLPTSTSVTVVGNHSVDSSQGGTTADGEGFLDPSTGEWVPKEKNDKKSSVTPLKINLKEKQQDSPKVPSLKINVAHKERANTKHAFFADLDRSDRERAERKKKNSKSIKDKDKSKKKKKRKKAVSRYRSESEQSSAADSDSDYVD